MMQMSQQAPAPQIQPQVAPQGASPASQAQPPSAPQSQQSDPNVLQLVEEHLNSLPKDQQTYLVQYMTPELAKLFGIVLGKDIQDYFNKFADPNKMLVVQPSQQEHGGQQHETAQSGADAQQPKTNPPQASIMGV